MVAGRTKRRKPKLSPGIVVFGHPNVASLAHDKGVTCNVDISVAVDRYALIGVGDASLFDYVLSSAKLVDPLDPAVNDQPDLRILYRHSRLLSRNCDAPVIPKVWEAMRVDSHRGAVAVGRILVESNSHSIREITCTE